VRVISAGKKNQYLGPGGLRNQKGRKIERHQGVTPSHCENPIQKKRRNKGKTKDDLESVNKRKPVIQ